MPSVSISTANALHRSKLEVVAAYANASVEKQAPQTSVLAQTSVTVKTKASTAFTAEYLGPSLKAVAKLGSFGGDLLLGESLTEKSSVETWLEWTEAEVEVRMGRALTELLKNVLEPHLVKKTFLVTEQITIADISLALSLWPKMTTNPPADCPSVKRWFNTCLHQKEFAETLKKQSAGSAGSSLAASTAGSSSSSSSGSSGSVTAQNLMLKPEDRPVVQHYSECSAVIGGRTRIGRIHLAADQGRALIGQKLIVCGWVKKMREQAEFTFLEINDGSCFQDMQVVVDKECTGFDALKGAVNTGASVKCHGLLVESPAKGQVVEMALKAGDEVTVLGSVDAAVYPLPPKPHTREHLRTNAHLRPRSNLIGAVARVRSALAYATHEFFRRRGFLYVHTPLITASDCEGAGEMFQVTTLFDSFKKNPGEEGYVPYPKSAKDVDYSKDFFKAKSYLTVSGQLAVENYCCALSDVYTFGPTFRAENSHTGRHLAEFWMIEPELAFADLPDVMQCAEDYLKFCVQYAVDNCYTDLQFFDKQIEKGLLERLKNLLDNPFGRLSYTEAIDLLTKEVASGKFKKYLEKNYADHKKSFPALLKIEWGMDLNSAHEKYIAEEYFKRPVAVYNYPAAIKSFYMRANEDGRTCAAMDVLAPLVGEVIGGSQREERHDVLVGKIKDGGLEEKDYWWYLDLRKYGTVPHGGFGLGFERLIMLTTGIDNIRDVIPFPRYPGHAEF